MGRWEMGRDDGSPHGAIGDRAAHGSRRDRGEAGGWGVAHAVEFDGQVLM